LFLNRTRLGDKLPSHSGNIYSGGIMLVLTQSKLKESLHYAPDTGIFTRLVRSTSRKNVGDVAGGINKENGYRYICVNGKKYMAHRLAVLYMTGKFPSEDTDHKNHIRSDNRWKNLRCVTPAINGRNRSKSIMNTTGVTGVYLSNNKRRWVARICVHGESKFLGSFTTLILAGESRRIAEIKYDFHQNHGQ